MASRPELKLDDEGGFVRFFKSLPPAGGVTDSSSLYVSDGDNPPTIRVFDRGDYYTAHGPDARYIARTVYRSAAVLRQLGSARDGLESVTMSITVFKGFLRDALLKENKRVEIWEKPSGTKNGWKVGKAASPGNLQDVEDVLGENLGNSAPMILAAKLITTGGKDGGRTVGTCFCDASVRELGVAEFMDGETFANFESLVIQLGVREVVVQADVGQKDVELAKLRAVAENCGCAVTMRAASEFTARDVEVDLERLLKGNEAGWANLGGNLGEKKAALAAAAALIKYLALMSDSSNFGQFALYQHDLAQFMRLDASAVRALHLMPGPRDGSKTMSLYGLLDHCRTPMGHRLLAQWLKQPLMNIETIERRQQLVEAFVEDTQLRQEMQEDHLRSIPDLYRLAKKFQRKKATLEDVIRAYQASTRLAGLVGALDGVMDEKYKEPLDEEYTKKLLDMNASLGKLQEMVESTIDLAALDNHEYIIKPEFDENLQAIKKKVDSVKRKIDAEHRRVGNDLNQEVDKKLLLDNNKTHGWCFRLTRAEANCIRNRREYKEIQTLKAGVLFTTDELLNLRREFDQLSQKYNSMQSGLAGEVIGVAGSYCPVFEKLGAILAHLDVIISFAHVSVNAPTPYVKPKMHPRGTGNTILKEARHPCMEVQDDVNFITNDVALVRGSSEFLIITGPNMGGKSTYIRQIGVIALLAQTGCFVPCSEAELCVFDSILARVGASDSQLKGVSTFMAEMLETASILKSATRESLIVIDELGRGTSTYDGFGLAWAIAEHIVKEIGAFALFATHFHELTALADAWPQVENLHVVAHVEGEDSATDPEKRRQVTLLYKVEPGACDQSFGIHVAELVRFPDKVVRMAKRKADELEDFEGKQMQMSDSDAVTTDEMERGSELLKDVLQKWKAETEGKNLSADEQVEMMRTLVKSNEELSSSKFFKGVMAL